MNIVGYVRFAVHPTNDEGFLIDFKCNDIALESYLSENINNKIDCLIDLTKILKINPEVKGCLVLATFDFKDFSSFNGETTEWDSDTFVCDVIVLGKDYKEQWRRNISYKYGYTTLEELENNEVSDALEEISDWEEFYGEEFTFYQEEIKTTSIFSNFEIDFNN